MNNYEMIELFEALSELYDFETDTIAKWYDEMKDKEFVVNNRSMERDCLEKLCQIKAQVRDEIEERKNTYAKKLYHDYKATNSYAVNLAIYQTYGPDSLVSLDQAFIDYYDLGADLKIIGYDDEEVKTNKAYSQLVLQMQYDGKTNDDYYD